MPRFSDIAKGTRARKSVPFPIANTRCELLADLPELAAQRAADKAAWEKAAQAGQAPPVAPDGHVTVDLRVLTGAEEVEVLQKATAFAIERGVESPKDGDTLYELAKMAETLALGVIDHDSPESAPIAFFDGGARQILDEIDGDRIAFLYGRWQVWQGQCSPRFANMTAAQFCEQVVKVTVNDDDANFLRMHPVQQLTAFRTLGSLLLSSPEGKSLFTSALGGGASSAKSAAS